MKKLLLSILFVAVSLMVTAQTQLSESQTQEVICQLTQVASTMQSMQCRFVQEKTSSMLAEPSVAEGTMHYAAPDRMRWEYTAPYAFALVVNGERLVKVTDGKAEVLEGNAGRMYQGMVNLIIGSASGKKLFDTTVFDIVFYDDNGFWRADMTPKRRDMKRMFSQLVFHFDKKTKIIDHVEFIGSGGDVTLIRFEEMKVNEAISDKVFAE